MRVLPAGTSSRGVPQASYSRWVGLVVSPPGVPYHRNPRLNRPRVRSLESDIWNLGLASPTKPSVPTIWVAEESGAMRNAPSDVPKPAVLNAGTGSDMILLRFK